MKQYDFSKLNGFPTTQNRLAYMQEAYTETIRALASMAGDGPVKIAGMVDMGATVTDGWLYYNGDVIPFVGGSKSATIKVDSYSEPLVFNGGTSYNVQNYNVASFGTGAVQFSYADLKTFQAGFGIIGAGPWIDFSVAHPTNGLSMSGKCRINVLTRQLQIRAEVGTTDTSIMYPNEWMEVGDLPISSLLLAEPAPFHAFVHKYTAFSSVVVDDPPIASTDDFGGIDTILCRITGRKLYIILRAPAPGVTAYSGRINVAIQID